MSREAMQMALEALDSDNPDIQLRAATYLRQALVDVDDMSRKRVEEKAKREHEWVGLTDEQVEDEWERITGHSIFGGDRSEGRAMYISPDEVIEFYRAIEAKLKEKNT